MHGIFCGGGVGGLDESEGSNELFLLDLARDISSFHLTDTWLTSLPLSLSLSKNIRSNFLQPFLSLSLSLSLNFYSTSYVTT